jgi:small conductance mechanosensitive channel
LESENPEKELLQARIRSIIAEQSKVLHEEIRALGKIINRMRSDNLKLRENDRLLQLSIERAETELDRLLTAWQKNVQRGVAAKMDVKKENDQLNRMLEMRVITLATRIRLDLDTIHLLKQRFDHATDEEKKKIEQELNVFELRKSADAKNLEAVIRLMNKQGLETTQFGQLLVIATGEILNENVDTKAVVGLLKAGLSKTLIWLHENLALVVFRLFSSMAILFGFRILATLFRGMVSRSVSRSDAGTSQLLKNLLASMTSKVVMFIGVIIALSQLGIEIGPLLAGMGILGFVTGFALKDALSNFAAGMMILFYHPFDIGDAVEAGGVLGKVKEMSLVTTTILTFDNQEMVVPNTKIWGNTIRNITSQPYRRVDMTVHVGHDVDLDRAAEALHEIIDEDERILKDPPPTIRTHKITDYSVEFVVRPWARTEDYWPVYWDLTKAIKMRLDAEGIAVPYPKRDVFLHQPS